MPDENEARPRAVHLTRDIVAGYLLIALAFLAYVGASGLSNVDGTNVGPGMLPKATALMIGAVGIVVLITGLLPGAARLDGFALRAPLFVLGAVVLFAATVRTLGLAFAGPLAIAVSALADRDSRPVEIAIFAVVLTVLSLALFKWMLRLPIPLAPIVLGY